MKNTYYFPHDYHARHDPKLERLRMLYGCVTDGIYWCLVEMMYEQGGYLAMDDMPVFAKLLNTDIDIINKVIGSDLFKQKDGKCYSSSVLDRLIHINKVREDRKHAGKLGGDAKAVANAKQMLSNIKESKGKEIINNLEVSYPFLKTVAFKTAYMAFLDSRKKMGHPATNHAQELLLKELHKDTVEVAIKRIEQSIVNGWQGIFPLKNQPQGGTQWKKP